VATNHIRDVSLRPVATDDDDGGHAMVIALELAEPTALVGFLEEVVGRFKAERMAAPPDARFLLIMAVGDVSAGDFADAWRASIANDASARALLGTLQAADVMQGDPHGVVIGQASLLASEPPPGT